jgi:hypothetical protein
MERYLEETVTSRRIPFTLEGIEKLKDLRLLISPDKENLLPYPTVLNEMIISMHARLVHEGIIDKRDITKGE